MEEIVAKALEGLKPQLEGLSGKLNQLSDIQAGMIREDYGKKIKGSFPSLDDDDVSRVFASYQKDRSTSLMEHAKKLSEKKTAYLEGIEKSLAEKWGVDLTKVKEKDGKNENDVKDAKSGGAGAMFQGKKFSMREKGEGFVSPKKAAREYLDTVME